MTRWKALVPVVLALVIASGGSVALYHWVQGRMVPKEFVAVASESVPVVVAAVDVPWGTKLRRDMLKTSPYFRESLPAGFRSDPGALEGRVVIQPLKQSEPVIEARLAPENTPGSGVAAVVQPGKRAVAVKGDKVIGISGFIQPGNRVDVLVTLHDPTTKSDVTKLVLDNILVLASGTEIQQTADGKPAPVDVYTLEVNPEQGEKLALAAAQGKLQFALRNALDTEGVLTPGATIPQTLASLRKPQAPPARHSRPVVQQSGRVSAAYRVEEIRGGKVTKNKFDEES